MTTLTPDSVKNSELVEKTFEYWFDDHQHIRSPFPGYIRSELKDIALKRFYGWLSGLKEDSAKEINDNIISEKFEEIIFESALKLVLTDDERISINYPFMPRIGDILDKDSSGKEQGSSIVTDRSLIKKEDLVFLKVKLKNQKTGEGWETRFELQA